MTQKWMIPAVFCAVLAAGCASKKGFEKAGYAFGCPIGEAKVSSMEDLVRTKVVPEGRRTTIQATEMRCSQTGELIRIDTNLNNDSRSVKRIAYKFRWIDREGMRAWDEEPWKPLMLHENSNLVINTISPTAKAVDFRLMLRSEE